MSGKAVRETLAALGVIASLVFVGVQIRQNTVAQRAETRQGLADAARDLNMSRATDRNLARAWAVWRPEYDAAGTLGELTLLDTLQARFGMYAMLRHAENVFLQYQEGAIGRGALSTYGFTSRSFQTAAFQEYWDTQRQFFDAGFVQAFEEANGLAS